MSIQIKCSYDQLVPISELRPNPKNRNIHSREQIERLSKILQYQGMRKPIIVSKRSGLMTAGHGRLLALKELGEESAPVNFQEYDSDEQEAADMTADNAIAAWAELDFSGINADLSWIGPDFDVNMLGIKDFEIEPSERKRKVTLCAKCGETL